MLKSALHVFSLSLVYPGEEIVQKQCSYSVKFSERCVSVSFQTSGHNSLIECLHINKEKTGRDAIACLLPN